NHREEAARSRRAAYRAVDDGKWYARAVGSRGVEALAHVLRCVVAAKNGLLLAQDSFPRANVVVKNRAWRYERFVLKPYVGRAEFRVLPDGSVVRGLGEFDAMRGRKSVRSVCGQIHDAQIRQAALAFEKYEVRLESLHSRKHDIRTIRNDLAP